MKDVENEASSLRRQLDLAAEKVRIQEENSNQTQVACEIVTLSLMFEFLITRAFVPRKNLILPSPKS